jgi:hypothetical protein
MTLAVYPQQGIELRFLFEQTVLQPAQELYFVNLFEPTTVEGWRAAWIAPDAIVTELNWEEVYIEE